MVLPRVREFRHVRELDGELLIVDDVLDVAHRLRPEAARVWRACDGASDPAAIARAARVSQPTADAALAELERLGLLDDPGSEALATRRTMLRKAVVAGAGASVGLTLVSSVLLPTPAQAFQSDGDQGGGGGDPGHGDHGDEGGGHGEGGGQGDGGGHGTGDGDGPGSPLSVLVAPRHKRHKATPHRRKHHRRHKPHGKHHHHKAKSHHKSAGHVKRHRRHG